jgi:hypothetical protein
MSNKDTFTGKKIEYAPLKEEYEIRTDDKELHVIDVISRALDRHIERDDKYKSMQRCLMFVLDRINSCLAEK